MFARHQGVAACPTVGLPLLRPAAVSRSRGRQRTSSHWPCRSCWSIRCLIRSMQRLLLPFLRSRRQPLLAALIVSRARLGVWAVSCGVTYTPACIATQVAVLVKISGTDPRLLLLLLLLSLYRPLLLVLGELLLRRRWCPRCILRRSMRRCWPSLRVELLRDCWWRLPLRRELLTLALRRGRTPAVFVVIPLASCQRAGTPAPHSRLSCRPLMAHHRPGFGLQLLAARLVGSGRNPQSTTIRAVRRRLVPPRPVIVDSVRVREDRVSWARAKERLPEVKVVTRASRRSVRPIRCCGGGRPHARGCHGGIRGCRDHRLRVRRCRPVSPEELHAERDVPFLHAELRG